MSWYHRYPDKYLGTSGWTPVRVRWVPHNMQKKNKQKKHASYFPPNHGVEAGWRYQIDLNNFGFTEIGRVHPTGYFPCHDGLGNKRN